MVAEAIRMEGVAAAGADLKKRAAESGGVGFGAGDGNRTRVNSLEGYRTTIVLHPLVVARAGFEPAISGLKGRRPSPLDERARSRPIIAERAA
jgi:hypothetical protein